MKYQLPRPLINPALIDIIHRELKKQKIVVHRLLKKNLQELAKVSKAIQEHGYPDHLIRKKLSGQLGYGIFLHPDATAIPKGQVIASYAGDLSIVVQNEPDEGAYAFAPLEEMHLSKEEQRHFDKKHTYHPRRLYALKLDAYKKGNFTRFINHSEKPNLSAEMLQIPSNPYGLLPAPIEIIYFAKKTIHPGEQLLVSYEDGEKSYWKAFRIKPFLMTPQTFRLSSSGKLTTKGS